MSAQYVTLVLDLYDAQGNPVVRGTAQAAPSTQLPDPAEMMLIGQAPLTAAFRAGSLPSLRLVSTDSVGPQPDAWTYSIGFTNVPGAPPGFSFYLRHSDGATQYLSALAQVPAAQPGQQYVPLPLNAPLAGNVPVVTSASPLVIQWQANSGADKNHTQTFTVASTVSVPHNLGKYPAVTVFDSAGDQCEGDPEYTDLNNLILTFSAPFSGTVTCN